MIPKFDDIFKDHLYFPQLNLGIDARNNLDRLLTEFFKYHDNDLNKISKTLSKYVKEKIQSNIKENINESFNDMIDEGIKFTTWEKQFVETCPKGSVEEPYERPPYFIPTNARIRQQFFDTLDDKIKPEF